MHRLTQLRCLWLVLVFGQAVNGVAAVASYPYDAIVDHNVFHLQPPPPPIAPPSAATTPKVLPQVFVTGMTDVCGSKQALVEITQPGKAPIKPVLMEGERVGPVEVVLIDIKQGQVKVKICGEESVLMLRAPPSSVSASAGSPVPSPSSSIMRVRR
jgi:hypothetical protein